MVAIRCSDHLRVGVAPLGRAVGRLQQLVVLRRRSGKRRIDRIGAGARDFHFVPDRPMVNRPRALAGNGLDKPCPLRHIGHAMDTVCRIGGCKGGGTDEQPQYPHVRGLQPGVNPRAATDTAEIAVARSAPDQKMTARVQPAPLWAREAAGRVAIVDPQPISAYLRRQGCLRHRRRRQDTALEAGGSDAKSLLPRVLVQDEISVVAAVDAE